MKKLLLPLFILTVLLITGCSATAIQGPSVAGVTDRTPEYILKAAFPGGKIEQYANYVSNDFVIEFYVPTITRQIEFKLTNLSDKYIKVLWEESYFINNDGDRFFLFEKDGNKIIEFAPRLYIRKPIIPTYSAVFDTDWLVMPYVPVGRGKNVGVILTLETGAKTAYIFSFESQK